MRISHLLFIAVPVALFWSAGATAQTHRFSWTPQCTATETHTIKVGDQPGHALGVAQYKCTSTEPSQFGTDKFTTGVATVTSEDWGTKSRDNGWQIVTMENGDQVSMPYHGVSATKDGKLTETHGTFEFTDGTGKLKGITGKGKYACKPAGDALDCTVTGEYHMK